MARRRKPPPPLHELEAEIMDVVWDRGETTVREVMEVLNARTAPPRAYTTYMTVMVRLDGKGLLKRRRRGRTDIYRPPVSREDYRAARAEAEVGAVVDEFGDLALAHFARQMAALDPARRRELQRLARQR
jgi:predicted transcriptional regulator